MNLKPYARILMYLFVTAAVFVPSVCCMKLSVSSDSGGFTENIGAKLQDSVMGNTVISSSGLSSTLNAVSATGSSLNLKESHSRSEKNGNTAEVGVTITNADLYDYSFGLYPDQDGLDTPYVRATQDLSVYGADSIAAYAVAYHNYKSGSADDVGASTEVTNGDLERYSSIAMASANSVSAFQTFDQAHGSNILCHNWYRLLDPSTTLTRTSLEATSSLKADISTSVKGAVNDYLDGTVADKDFGIYLQQGEHVYGKFTSKQVAGTQSSARTSNYGSEYDLNMHAGIASGSQEVADIIGGLQKTSGIVGYYVDPSMKTSTTGAIQGAVNAAKAGDTINVAAGYYNENLKINKEVGITGTGVKVKSITNNAGVLDLNTPISGYTPDPITVDSKVVLIKADDVWYASPGFNWLKDLVKSENIAATFSLIPSSLVSSDTADNWYFRWLKRVDKNQIELATHGFGHEDFAPRSGSPLNYDMQYNLLRLGRDAMTIRNGYRPHTAAAPYGDANIDTLDALAKLGYHSSSSYSPVSTSGDTTASRIDQFIPSYLWETSWDDVSDNGHNILHSNLDDFKVAFDTFTDPNNPQKYFLLELHPYTFYAEDGSWVRQSDVDTFEAAIDYMKGSSSNIVFSTIEQAYQYNH